MADREVLRGSASAAAWWSCLAVINIALLVTGDARPWRIAVVVALLAVAAGTVVSRHTVLDAAGVKVAGDLRRRTPWSAVLDVRRSRSAMAYGDVELDVRDRDQPLRVKERRDGADLAAITRWWHEHRATEPAEPAEHLATRGHEGPSSG